MKHIMLEGPEYAGKSTYARSLKAKLEVEGKRVLMVNEPGGTPVGEVMRSLVKEYNPVRKKIGYTPLNNFEHIMCMFTSRSQLCRSIRASEEPYDYVIWDRGYVSTLVYQFLSKDEQLDLLFALLDKSETIIPDEIVIMLPTKEALERAIQERGEEVDPLGIDAVQQAARFNELYKSVEAILTTQTNTHDNVVFTYINRE